MAAIHDSWRCFIDRHSGISDSIITGDLDITSSGVFK